MIKNHACKILVVEDEVVIALRLKQMLTKMGYDVIGVSYSGENALEKVRNLRLELVLMDIILPGNLDGIAIAEIVESELNVPVIFLTAFSKENITEKSKNAERFGYISKPFQDHEIKAAIEIALSNKQM